MMKAELEYKFEKYIIDFSRGSYLGIPLKGVVSPLFFTEQAIDKSNLEVAGFSGCVATGAGCNVEQISFIPHCHGTHTEGSGHISATAESVQSLVEQTPCPAQLISLQPETVAECTEIYNHKLPDDYPLFSLVNLQAQLLEKFGDSEVTSTALIIRSLPNSQEKTSRNYNQQPYYPLLTTAAINWLAASGLQHLLLDMPSLDYANDEGVLFNHHSWWGMHSAAPENANKRSLSEMIYVDNSIADGHYWLELNISCLESDASPSNPKIYPLQKVADL